MNNKYFLIENSMSVKNLVIQLFYVGMNSFNGIAHKAQQFTYGIGGQCAHYELEITIG